jgi:hypothetical protein
MTIEMGKIFPGPANKEWGNFHGEFAVSRGARRSYERTKRRESEEVSPAGQEWSAEGGRADRNLLERTLLDGLDIGWFD